MKDRALDVVSSLSTPMTRIRDSAPPAWSCWRTAAANGGSSWWQLGHQFPKKSSTAGVPSPPPSDGTETCGRPDGPMFGAVKDGTGPPSWGVSVELWLVPMLVVSPMSTMIRRPMPRPMRMKRLRGLRTAGGAPPPAPPARARRAGPPGPGAGRRSSRAGR